MPNGQSALHVAVLANHKQCVKILLAYGANPRLVSREGKSVLEVCEDPVMKEILTTNPLYWMSKFNNLQLIGLMLPSNIFLIDIPSKVKK
mmetsp:Transcript_4737/g.2656  ORF Transcript_4737/g.2656 Transcript_4737/m.2656 type:complete len:90 (+) Transcript_4737:475-744(+)